MSPPRSQRPDLERGTAGGTSTEETPDLNLYEIHADRTVFTEPDNTDGWIATDYTVTPLE